MLRILDPLIDYAAARNNVPWAADDPVVLDIHDGVGGKSGIARVVTGWAPPSHSRSLPGPPPAVLSPLRALHANFRVYRAETSNLHGVRGAPYP